MILTGQTRQADDRGSSPRESSWFCPHCGDQIGPDDEVVTTLGLPIRPGDFTVCPSCREIVRFNKELQLKKMCGCDWLDLCQDRELFVGLLRWRMQIFIDQLREQSIGHSVDGIPGSW